MPTLACPRLSAWHAGPCLSSCAPANRGLSNNSGGTLPCLIKGYPGLDDPVKFDNKNNPYPLFKEMKMNVWLRLV